ncbi:hypothetical protein [Mesorhizobium sp. NBSH29]|uniref:hypothetical protein n=1 Tax=Mesorhizobium sp. NBSH29 TaxID=2654249 RepID=UPI00189645A0|nr:hypothetical protein [Mesorhizobium sp. NBSH29]
MAHIGLTLHWRNRDGEDREALNPARFAQEVEAHSVASANTAAAFLVEMHQYGVIRTRPSATDRRLRLYEPTPVTIGAIDVWMRIHLATLDALDGADRGTLYAQAPDGLQTIQPLIAVGLLSSHPIREPTQDFSQFMWLNNGFLIMERLIASVEQEDATQERAITGLTSVSRIAEGLSLSRTHAARKIREAEAAGSLGWEGQRGRSRLWISNQFRHQFLLIQAEKLAIIDAAFEQCFGSPQLPVPELENNPRIIS